MSYYIGIDIGTTHLKTGIFSEEGEAVWIKRDNTPLSEEMGSLVYDPKEIKRIVLSQIEKARSTEWKASGIAITGMAEAGLIMNPHTKEEVSSILPWFEQSTTEYAGRVTLEKEKEYFFRTGLRNSFKYGIYKYLWLLEKMNLKKEDTLWLSICDYVAFVLTGEFATEPTFAARTYVYDIGNKCWDESHIREYGLSLQNFPRVFPSGESIGFLKETDIPVAICGHDHICSAFGMNLQKNEICNSMGTAETFVGIQDSFEKTEENYASGLVYGPYVDGKSFFGLGNISSSGGSVEWMRKQTGKEAVSYEIMNEMLAETGEGPGEILYFPFLSGIGTPVFDARAAAAFLGIRQEHELKDMFKAVIEGVSYQARWILELGFFKEKDTLLCTGGAVNSVEWMQIKSNVTGRKLEISKETEGTLLGAVMLFIMKQKKKTGNQRETISYLPKKEIMECYETAYKDKYKPWLPLLLGQEKTV